MKKILFCLTAAIPMLFLSGFAAYSQTTSDNETALITYDGGFFVRNGSNWTEYRPFQKEGFWASYTQYSQDGNYYYISNSSCKVAIPTTNTANSIYILRDEEWKPIYTTRDIYNYFTDSSYKIYSYEGGYFVRDGKNWREYRPSDKVGAWSYYEQTEEQEYYYIIKSSANEVAIPKKDGWNVYLKVGDEWKVVYTGRNNYELESRYDYVAHFDSYVKKGEDIQDVKSAICFSRDGTGVIMLGSQHYSFSFNQAYAELDYYDEASFYLDEDPVDMIIIGTDEKHYVYIDDDYAEISYLPDIPFELTLEGPNEDGPKSHTAMAAEIKLLSEDQQFFK